MSACVVTLNNLLPSSLLLSSLIPFLTPFYSFSFLPLCFSLRHAGVSDAVGLAGLQFGVWRSKFPPGLCCLKKCVVISPAEVKVICICASICRGRRMSGRCHQRGERGDFWRGWGRTLPGVLTTLREEMKTCIQGQILPLIIILCHQTGAMGKKMSVLFLYIDLNTHLPELYKDVQFIVNLKMNKIWMYLLFPLKHNSSFSTVSCLLSYTCV